MCFSEESQPPIRPVAGASVEQHALVLTAADGNRFAAFRADAAEPSGDAVLVLPDVRGLFGYYEELAIRFAEIGVDALAPDYYGRTAGASRRDADFAFAEHTPRTTWSGLQADVTAAAEALRSSRGVRRLFSIGFCFGGRVSLLLSGLPELDMAGVIAFYGWPVGPSLNDTPAPIDQVGDFGAPVLAIFGGADERIPAAQVDAFEAALSEAGVPHRVLTFEDAPHSFFDRGQQAYADASARSWAAVLETLGRDEDGKPL
jgi:carboxymethylenebutenolidase